MLSFLLDILSEPAILIGIFALIGLIVQRKSVSETISGTLKSILGFLIIGGGATILVSSLDQFGPMIQEAFNFKGVVPNNEAITAVALKDFGTQTALIMAFGMIVNIAVARFTKLKYIFLTGHHTLFMACMIAAILISGNITGIPLVIIGSVLLGVLMAVMPAIAHPTMKKITGQDEVGFGHFGTIGYVISAGIGKLVGKGSKSTEELNFPKGLSFLRDTSVAISLTMAIIYIITALVAGPEFIETNLSGGKNYIVFAIMQAVTFAAGVYIILAGVRLLIGEIVPAFKGIAEKVVPNAKPCLDCPVVFPYAPNAVIIGFLCSFLGGIVGMFILIGLNATVIIPGLVPHFFCGATAGVFGNATGGKRGAVIGSFIHGLVITFLPVLLLPVLGSLGFANTTYGDADFGVVGILLGYIIQFIQ